MIHGRLLVKKKPNTIEGLHWFAKQLMKKAFFQGPKLPSLVRVAK
jgi:hypothetical protein